MHHYSLPKKVMEVVSNLCKCSTGVVLSSGLIYEPLKCNIGVRQGCLLSPALFNLFLERNMTEALENALPRVTVGGRPLEDLHFADDIALLAINEQDLQNNTSSLNRTA